MFTEDEIEAIVLGSRWVADRGDARLSAAARNALTKIAAVLPNDLCNTLDATALLVGPGATITAGDEEIPQIRRAIRAERKLEISYHSLNSVESTRTVWPFALGYFEHVRVLVAWCEMRQDSDIFALTNYIFKNHGTALPEAAAGSFKRVA